MTRWAALATTILFFSATGTQAQTYAAQPVFEVAAVKPIPDDAIATRPTRSGGRFTWTTDFFYLISYAYHLEINRLSGAIPGHAPIYRVDAVMDPATPEDKVRLMLQSLLVDRFKLQTHRASKEVDGYGLTIRKGGPKIQPVKPEDPPPPLPEWSKGASIPGMEGRIVAIVPANGVTAITGRRVSMQQLAQELELDSGQMVWDRTGLDGKYYFAFRYANTPDAETDAPTLATALQETLGLRMEKQKGPVETLVVDHIEREPTEN